MPMTAMGLKKLFSSSGARSNKKRDRKPKSCWSPITDDDSSSGESNQNRELLLPLFPNTVLNDRFDNRGDDVSSIHLGESVSSPPRNHPLKHNTAMTNQNQSRSISDLNMIVDTSSHNSDGLFVDDGELSSVRSPSRGKQQQSNNDVVVDSEVWKKSVLEEEEKKDEIEKGAELALEEKDDRSAAADQRSLDQTTLDGVEIYDSQGLYNSTLAADRSIFCLSLLKNDTGATYKTLSERIVKNSLERHLRLLCCECECECEATPNEIDDGSFDIMANLSECAKKTPGKVEIQAQKLITQSKYDQAIVVYNVLLQHQRKQPGGESVDTLGKLSLLYLLVGNMEGSLSYAKRALQLNREESRQAQVATSLMVVGLVYFGGNRPDKAVRFWREALQMTCMVFGYDHPHVATLLNNLGCLHYHEGDFGASLKTLSESLDLHRKFLGGSSVGSSTDSMILDISFTIGNIAAITARNGNLDSAVSLLEEVLSLQESAIVPVSSQDHFLIKTTTDTIDRLSGSLFKSSSFPSSAFRRPFLGGTISVASKKTHGTSEAAAASNAQTVDTFQPIHVEESRLDHQSTVFGDSDGIPARNVGGKSNPVDAIDSSDNLDVVLLGSLVNEYTPRQRIRSVALCWFGKTLQDDEDRKLPFVPFAGTPRKRMRIPVDLDHGGVMDAELHLQSIHEQAADHIEHDEIDEALELFKSSLCSHRDKYGDMHHLVGTANHNIGLIHLYAQQYPQALTFLQEAVIVRQAALGPDHPAVADSLMKIGMIFLLQRDPESAKATFLRILKLVRKALGYGDIQVARVLNNIAVADYDQGAYLDAFRTFQEAHEIQRRLLDFSLYSENSSIIPLNHQTKIIELALSNTLSNIGFLYCRQYKYIDSLHMLQEADKLRRKHVGNFHPDMGCVGENLHYLRSFVGDVDSVDVDLLETQGDHLKDSSLTMLCTTTLERFNSGLRC